MRARLASLSPRVVLALGLVFVALHALATWFLLVGPKRAEVARLAGEVVSLEAQLGAARAEASRPRPPAAPVPVAEIVSLAKAMPASADQAGLVLELGALARRSGVTLRSFSPGAVVAGPGGASMIPVTVSLEGRYLEVARFLRLARGLVAVRGDRVVARGRLLVPRSVELAESRSAGFPRLDATIALDAYVYDGPLAVEGEEASDEVEEPASQAAGGSTS
ncbi:MAG: type 4a pilus biogenesis protein PilO [Gaiellaceae bacterium]|nr:type 4a pilus biogenesis protein PilO [Gaiellaceae bacterium]